jgi:hypothetical protein
VCVLLFSVYFFYVVTRMQQYYPVQAQSMQPIAPQGSYEPVPVQPAVMYNAGMYGQPQAQVGYTQVTTQPGVQMMHIKQQPITPVDAVPIMQQPMPPPGYMMDPMAQPGVMMTQPGVMMQPVPQAGYMVAPMAQPGYMMAPPGVMMVQPGMMMQPIAQAGLMMMAPAPMYSADPFAPLVNMDMLIVDQQYDVLEAITGIEGKNKYKIYTRHGLKYFAQEESEPCARCCLGPHVGLTVYYRSIDKNGPEVLRLEKPFMCCCPVLLPCCQKEATLKINNGMDTVAYFQQPMFGGCFTPTIDIYDRQGGSKIGYMTGPCCCVGGFFDDKFEVFDATGSSVAKFQRMGASDVGDVAKFLTSDADRFGIHFDPTLDLKLKSLVLGIVIFLDYLYFEVILLCAVLLFLLIRNVCHLERWTLQT